MEIEIQICKNEFEGLGLLDIRFNPLSPDEDINIPIRSGDIRIVEL